MQTPNSWEHCPSFGVKTWNLELCKKWHYGISLILYRGMYLKCLHYLFEAHFSFLFVSIASSVFQVDRAYKSDVIIKTMKRKHHCFVDTRKYGTHENRGRDDISCTR